MNPWRDSLLLRILGTAALVLLLQIPIQLIASTIAERRATRDEALEEVTRTWGGPQQLGGPVLLLADGKRVPPTSVLIRGRVETEVRRRGMFDVPLYVATLHVEGSFPAQAQAQAAQLLLSFTDARNVRTTSLELADDGVRGPLTVKASAPTPFSFDVSVAGSASLWFIPSAAETRVELSSGWPTPGFDGTALPVSRTLGAGGFEASWRVLRGAAQGFGVRFVSPTDTYRSSERAVKYELLFLGLTFLAFTLFELLGGLRVHPVQSLLVGLALCLFFLLLLSLSEQVGFARAYAIAACAVVLLVTFYVRAVLNARGRALAVGGLLSGLYGFLYVLLQIEDYALLTGSVALFAVLASVMWFTRRVDWYQLRATPPPPELSL